MEEIPKTWPGKAVPMARSEIAPLFGLFFFYSNNVYYYVCAKYSVVLLTRVHTCFTLAAPNFEINIGKRKTDNPEIRATNMYLASKYVYSEPSSAYFETRRLGNLFKSFQ